MMQAGTRPYLIAQDLACRRGDRILFRGLSVELAAGDALHVTGANGVGKTTLIKAMAGLLTPFTGEIDVGGSIGLVDDRPALDPDLPLEKALAFWARVDQCVDPSQAIASLGLQSLLDVPVQYLSTGQKKRGALAALINSGAQIWLLDEPLSGLDKDAVSGVNTLIERHIKRGGIALIASHQKLAIDGLKTLAIEDYAP
ncbi:MAG: heme ABC exporter ATP-binding protein CcmA [Pseudomonadota bacterium]